MKNQNGYTLVELLIVLVIVFIVCGYGLIGAGVMGNAWFTEKGVLKKIQANHPKITKLIDTERNMFRYSVITVEENDQRKQYDLDSNVLFNYKILNHGSK
ncbi:MAG TPA: hypothetical protein DEA43_01185 [Candidatus Moranbacteria bacterium]|nr:hypothetical protein [Candidatus Moranbacteria bacterium]HBT45484.1 hypothetical protein [Candidatus Moranbacteria bacterium]